MALTLRTFLMVVPTTILLAFIMNWGVWVILLKTDTIMRRSFWLALIDKEWQRPILWLSGVRRPGKTFLCKSIHGMEFGSVICVGTAFCAGGGQ
jgi:hypothetical protein